MPKKGTSKLVLSVADKDKLFELASTGHSLRSMERWLMWKHPNLSMYLDKNPEFALELDRERIEGFLPIIKKLQDGTGNSNSLNWLMRAHPDKMDYLNADKVAADNLEDVDYDKMDADTGNAS